MTLYIVSTPIGNLEDMTLRGLRLLKESDCIACEDTRQTIKLLNHYEIKKPLISYHAHSSRRRSDELLAALKQGKQVALVSDCGTPGISDPGGMLAALALENGIAVESVPGPSAVTAALASSGFPSDRFVFLGFLPRRSGRAGKLLQQAAVLELTIALYESPYRTAKTLALIQKLFGENILVAVARELTKKFEECIRGTVSHVLDIIKQREVLGEVVILIRANDNKSEIRSTNI
jgi:16S rRNA (cytidine1402-2'-O)-methyltransferase